MPYHFVTKPKLAKKVWEEFYNKYKELTFTRKGPGDAPAKTIQVKAGAKPIDQQSADRAAQLLQARWRFLRQSNRDVPVHVGKKHHKEFIYFLNDNRQAKKSLNQEKLTILQQALTDGKWNHPIFKDSKIAQLSLTLCQSNKISHQQLYTLLERIQTEKDFKLKQNYCIFSGDDFSKEAKEILIPALLGYSYFDAIKSPTLFKFLTSFRYLVSQLPLSEQYFYTTELGPYAVQGKDYLGQALDSFGVIQFNPTKEFLVHTSFGMGDAIGLITYGIDEYIRPQPRLGDQMWNDIEEGVRQFVRPTAIAFPNTVVSGKIHGYENVFDLEKTRHDYAHGKIQSTIPNNMISALHRFVDVCRHTVAIQNSKEIWTWIDCDFTYYYFNFHNGEFPSSVQETSKQFCQFLLLGAYTLPGLSQGGYVIVRSPELVSNITTLGIAIFLDMLKHKEAWLKLNLDPEHFISPFSTFYQTMKKHYESNLDFFQKHDDKTNLFVFDAFFKGQLEDDQFHQLLTWVDENQTTLAEDIQFKKFKKNESPKLDGQTNMVYTTFQGKKLDEELIHELITQHHAKPQGSF